MKAALKADTLAERLSDVPHILCDPVGVACLTAIGCHAHKLGSIRAAVAAVEFSTDPVLLVGPVPAELRTRLATASAEVWLLPDVQPSEVLKPGLSPDAAWRTWSAYAERAYRDNTPPPMIEEEGHLIEVVEPKRIESNTWPDAMPDSIRVGILGEVLDIVEEQTEADPAAITFDFLTRVGSLVGRGPHVGISGSRHGANLFVLIVGATAQGRKGTSAAYPMQIARRADPEWVTQSGLSSGEGLIHSVRDERDTGRTDKGGNPIIEPGVLDKRLTVVEPEFARVLRTSSRRENTLGPLLRQAWEGSSLSTMTRQPYSATDPHVSIIAHVTPCELRKLLSGDDIAGGTANRFLFCASRRQRELPFGGYVQDGVLDLLGGRLSAVVEFAQCNGAMSLTDDAAERWPHDYAELLLDEKAPGVAGAMLGRGAAQVRRLAMLFAICDRSRDVDVAHLEAAMSAWRYCGQTVRHIFGIRTGNVMADRIHDELKVADSELDRSQIRAVLPNASGADIEAALGVLSDAGIAHGRRVPTGKAGRPREVWRLGPAPQPFEVIGK